MDLDFTVKKFVFAPKVVGIIESKIVLLLECVKTKKSSKLTDILLSELRL